MNAAAPADQFVWQPQPGPQTFLITMPEIVWEVFFGGARGGGKTDGMLGDWLHHAFAYGAAASGVFFRRVYKQLEDVEKRAQEVFPRTGATFRKSDATWIWSSGPAKGAQLKFRHLWNEATADEYLGHAYTWICCEELTQWPTVVPIDKIKATLRSSKGVPVQFRATGNPGGPGHNWVKARYVSPAPGGMEPITDAETGQVRIFIPSRLEHNPLLTLNDPMYEARLKGSGTPELVRAWRYGDWDVVAGGFFDDVWVPRRQVIKPVAIPQHWLWRRSFDWGHSSPSSLGHYRVSDGTPLESGHYFPRGSLIRVSEWYSVQKDEQGLVKPNEGMRLANTATGAEIARRGQVPWNLSVADPSIFTKGGGESIYDQLVRGAREAQLDLKFTEADNRRVAGWMKLREMLEESTKDRPEKPGLWVFDTCAEWIRTVPVLQRDVRNPDDVDTEAEDHAADETRYVVNGPAARRRTMRISGS